MQQNEYRECRRLLSPAAGQVFPMRELRLSEDSERMSGEGFAVAAAGGIRGMLFRAAPAVEICAPADGAVTAVFEDSRGFRLRTGDGLTLVVELPEPAEFYISTGDLAAAGEPVCRVSQEGFRRGSAGAMVRFEDPERITEFHVTSGVKRSGKPAAQYSIREPE